MFSRFWHALAATIFLIRSVLWRGCGSNIGQEPRKPRVLDTDAGKSHVSSTSQGMVGICGNVMRNPNLPVSEVAYRKQIGIDSSNTCWYSTGTALVFFCTTENGYIMVYQPTNIRI